MTAKLAPLFRRWIDHAKNIALLAAVAGGGIYGYAYAIAPTVDTGRDFLSGVSINDVISQDGAPGIAYTVPAGSQFVLTDVIITPGSPTTSTVGRIFISGASNCTIPVLRLGAFRALDGESVHLPLVTGISFGPGKTVCLTSTSPTTWSLRGYLSSDT